MGRGREEPEPRQSERRIGARPAPVRTATAGCCPDCTGTDLVVCTTLIAGAGPGPIYWSGGFGIFDKELVMQPQGITPAQLLDRQLQSLDFHHGEDGRLAVANAFQYCTNDQEVRNQAEKHRAKVIGWLRAGLGDGDLVKTLKAHPNPPADQLLNTLNLLIRNLNQANRAKAGLIEEEKRPAHVAEPTLKPLVAAKIAEALTPLQAFLAKHDDHFTVLVEGQSLNGYLNTILKREDFTCNNEVATAMSNALRDQFHRMPPCVEVGKRLLPLGFFESGTEVEETDHLADFERYKAMGKSLKGAVKNFATGDWSADDVASFQLAYEEADELLGIYVNGQGIKKKMFDLNDLVEKHVLDPDNGGLILSIKDHAARIKFM